MNIQVVADRNYSFISVSIKWPGCVHDGCAFSNSSIYTKIRNDIIPKWRKVIVENEPPVPVCTLGDPEYLLLPFLMKEFPNGGRN